MDSVFVEAIERPIKSAICDAGETDLVSVMLDQSVHWSISVQERNKPNKSAGWDARGC